ncbi:hypothetical protein F2P45_19990 [Massilia sp. CCM 8733]|uniref:Uncharacterized protein n=1 Tax=Massilia mucilaginosa TaxID=2609282 RepID=A0ABX0NWN7_9BURK|nr:hypothetical protein [Massilia mucilaginosa]NHZ91277.1 hypothetical protein [Massilia mucilaginosa]
MHANPAFPPPASTARPAYLPWYVHVGLMVFTLNTFFFAHVFFGTSFYFWVWSTIIPGMLLAVAGKGNRLFFAALLVLVNAIAFAGLGLLEIDSNAIGVFSGMLICILVVLWPALLFWLAHTLNMRQRTQSTQAGGTVAHGGWQQS